MTAARILHPADYRRMRWKNGGGSTTQLAVHPADAGDADAAFDWRVSIAEIETDGNFSAFPGCERYIALLDGVGMLLQFDQAPDEELRQRLRFVRFDGDWRTYGRLLSGPVRDFNIIVRRDAVAAQVMHRPLVGPMVFFAEADAVWFVHLAAGTATLKNREGFPALQAGDSLLLEPDGNDGSLVLDGGGELILAKFSPAARPS